MTRVKQQLKAFYKAQGLRGKRLKRAVWADVGRVKTNQDMSNDKYDPQLHDIASRMAWSRTPEGHAYWMVRQGWRA